MGAIHVQVGLTNAIDAALVRRGLLPADQMRLCQCTAPADCANQRLVPNPAHPDQPVSTVK